MIVSLDFSVTIARLSDGQHTFVVYRVNDDGDEIVADQGKVDSEMKARAAAARAIANILMVPA